MLKELFLAKLLGFHLQLFKKMNIYAGRLQDSIYLKKTFLRNTSEWLLLSNLQHSRVQHFVASSLFQFLMTSSEYIEHFPGSNKVHYPVSNRKDFTLVLTSAVGRQNYINVWYMIVFIYCLCFL